MRPVILLVASLIAATPVAARKTPRRPCAGGTFVLQGAPLVLGSSAAPVESVRVDPGRLTLGACAGPAKLKATRAGTRVAAKLSGCAGVTGKLKVAAMIAPSCAQIQGTARGKRKLHATFIGTLSRCGDGFVDAAA